MRTSSYFEKAVFHDQPSAIDEFYEKKAGQLFEQSWERSYIEFHVQRPSHTDPHGSHMSRDELMTAPVWDSEDSDATTELSSPTEQAQNVDGPPQFTGAQMERWRISSTKELGYYAAVSPRECA